MYIRKEIMCINKWVFIDTKLKNMNYKIGFRLDWLEMVFVLASTLLAGAFLASDSKDKYIYFGIAILGAGGILIRRRVKMPLKDSKPK